jgi:hypothetical protein
MSARIITYLELGLPLHPLGVLHRVRLRPAVLRVDALGRDVDAAADVQAAQRRPVLPVHLPFSAAPVGKDSMRCGVTMVFLPSPFEDSFATGFR